MEGRSHMCQRVGVEGKLKVKGGCCSLLLFLTALID